jgi:hypothetical protein
MKDLFERSHGLIRQQIFLLNKKTCHFPLPARVDFSVGHARASALEIVGFQIADQQAIGPQEQRVITPAGLLQGLFHLRPNGSMAFFVLFNPFRLYLQSKTDPLHEFSSVS